MNAQLEGILLRYWPSFVRLSIYVLLSLLTSFQSAATLMTPEKLASMTPWDWSLFATGILVPPLVIVRAFIDKTVSNADPDGKRGLNIPLVEVKNSPAGQEPSA